MNEQRGRELAPGQLVAGRDQVTLVDLLDRVLDRGVVVTGDVVIALADVDLVYLNLRVLLASAERLAEGEQPAVDAGGTE